MTLRHIVGLKERLRAFLTSTLNGREWSASRTHVVVSVAADGNMTELPKSIQMVT